MSNETMVQMIQNGEDQKELMSLLWLQNERLIEMLARRYSHLYDSAEDAKQELYFIFNDAVQSYRADAGGKFSTWLTVNSKRLIRQSEAYTAVQIPSWLNALVFDYKKLISCYMAEYDRMPTDAEVMRSLQISEETFQSLKSASKMINMDSLDRDVEIEDDQHPLYELIASDQNIEQEAADKAMSEEIAEMVHTEVNKLPEVIQKVIVCKWFRDMTTGEISMETGLNEAEIRKHKADGMKQMRKSRRLRKWYSQNFAKVYNSSLSSFKRTNTSITEYIAMKLAECEEQASGDI